MSRIANRYLAAALLASIAAAPLSAAPKPAPAATIAAALADSGRPEADIKQDASRHPAELVAFIGVKPGMTVVDAWPGGGYWTRIFSKVVGPKGKVYAYVPSEILELKSDPMGKAKAVAAEPGRANVTAIADPLAHMPEGKDAGSVDIVWTFENYHDFHNPIMKGADVAGGNKAIYALLKPGGYYVIGDHAAVAGTGLANTNDLHRIDPAALRAEVEKAGFVFDGETKVLANPEDPKTAKVFDPALRGNTDRFVYRFRKPMK